MRHLDNEATARPEAILVAARRSPIGRLGGSLKTLAVEQLMAPVLRSLLTDTGLAADQVDEVILGNAIGPGGNPARVALLEAEFPIAVPGLTVDRQCGSGLAAINQGARLIQAGAAEVVIAGGMESCSTAPWRINKPRSLYELPEFTHRARFAPDALGDPDMGIAADTVAQRYGISRRRQDVYALQSHEKAIAAIQSARFQTEICPIPLSTTTVISQDECPKASMNLERLERLRPIFQTSGSVTVGNACPVNDGAAAVLMVSSQVLPTLAISPGIHRGLRLVDAIATGVDPQIPGIGPVMAVKQLFQRHPHWLLDQVGWVEFNEAFAAQVLACLDVLAFPQERVNQGGGAIALGHPYGASGAILVTRLFTDMVQPDWLLPKPTSQQDSRSRQDALSPSSSKNLCQNRHSHRPSLGLATLGIGGGLGVATLLELVTWP